MRTVLVALCAVLVPTSALAAKKPVQYELAPSSAWNLHYNENSCSLRREFGSGEYTIQVEYEMYAPGVAMSLRIAGKLLARSERDVETTVAFGPQELGSTSRTALAGTANNRLPAMLIERVPLAARWLPPADFKPAQRNQPGPAWPNPSPDEVLRVRAMVQTMSLTFGGRSIILHTGPFRAAMAQMDKCLAVKVAEWGVDLPPPGADIPAPEPLESPGMWLSFRDYPAAMLRGRESGVVRFRLLVGTDGKPEACTVISADGAPDFEATTCRLLMTRARFAPARDKDNNPIRGVFMSQVRWLTG